tara:strand:- start:212 stop:433 length:222 start_codon:yes stop_codon:yes gene_type:complete
MAATTNSTPVYDFILKAVQCLSVNTIHHLACIATERGGFDREITQEEVIEALESTPHLFNRYFSSDVEFVEAV